MLLGVCFYFYLFTNIFFYLILFLSKDIVNKRNPRLVPYNLLDEKTKKTNRDTVCSAVRTLIGYGYNIEPPDQESSKFLLVSVFISLCRLYKKKMMYCCRMYMLFMKGSSCVDIGADGPGSSRGDKIRVFRAEKSYSVTQGKWYFEFEAVTVGEMRVGWARPNVRADKELGADELGYVFNGFKVGTKLNACEGFQSFGNPRLQIKQLPVSGPTLAYGK